MLLLDTFPGAYIVFIWLQALSNKVWPNAALFTFSFQIEFLIIVNKMAFNFLF